MQNRGDGGGYDAKNIFARILRKDIPAKFVHEDSQCIAFRDVAPQAPTHILIIPRKPIAQLSRSVIRGFGF